MKPTISIIEDDLIQQILTEAKQILAEIGVEVMGHTLRERLLTHGLKQEPVSGRVLFPPDEVDRAIANIGISTILACNNPFGYAFANKEGELDVRSLTITIPTNQLIEYAWTIRIKCR